MSILFFLVFFLPITLVFTACKPGWVDWGGRCFYMSTGTKNWWDAKQDCIRRGGRLFEPRNKEVNELVYSNVPGPTKCYWIGISDIEHEDKYVYASDDQPLVYLNFRPGFPVSNATKNCFLYACDRSHPFKFWDYGCEVSIRYVCEEILGNSDCGIPDSFMVEESFKTADVESCKSICRSISACTFFTFSAQTLACGIKTYQPGGMIDFQNIESGSPFMSGTVRNKIFVGRHSRKRTAMECQKSCVLDLVCQSWTWTTLANSVPGTCSHNYGEVRGKISLPGANVVSGPKCCNGDCLQTPILSPAHRLLDRVLQMPSKLGIAHQDHGMFVFEEYEKEVAHQMSLINENSNQKDKMALDEWIGLAVKKVFKKKN